MTKRKTRSRHPPRVRVRRTRAACPCPSPKWKSMPRRPAFEEGVRDAIGADLRHRMISEAAYYRYAERGYRRRLRRRRLDGCGSRDRSPAAQSGIGGEPRPLALTCSPRGTLAAVECGRRRRGGCCAAHRRRPHRETRGGRGSVPAVELDSDLERELGLDSLERANSCCGWKRHSTFALPVHTPRTPESPAICWGHAGGRHDDARPSALPRPRARARRRHSRQAQTLVDVLDWHANARGAAHASHLLTETDAGPREEPLAYGELRELAGASQADLRPAGSRRASALRSCCRPRQRLLRAFFGALVAGCVPVPIYPPARRSQLEEHLRRQSRILDNCLRNDAHHRAEARPIARLLRVACPSLRQVASIAELEASAVEAGQRAARAAWSAGHRLPAVHVRQHGQPERRDPHPRQSARQHPCDGKRDRGRAHRRLRELAAALSRHGADRRVARQPLLRHPSGRDAADRFPRPAGELAARGSALRRDAVRRPNFATRCAHRASTPHGWRARPLALAHRVQRRRAGEPGHARALRRALRRLRLRPARADAGLRARGGRGGPRLPTARARPLVDRIDRAELARNAAAVPRDAADALAVVGCGRRWRVTKSRGRRTGREQPERREGRIEFRGPPLRRATSAIRRRREGCSATAGSTRATWATSPAASSSSRGASRTSSSAAASTCTRRKRRSRSARFPASARDA